MTTCFVSTFQTIFYCNLIFVHVLTFLLFGIFLAQAQSSAFNRGVSTGRADARNYINSYTYESQCISINVPAPGENPIVATGGSCRYFYPGFDVYFYEVVNQYLQNCYTLYASAITQSDEDFYEGMAQGFQLELGYYGL